LVNTVLLSLLCLAIAPYYHTILYNDDGVQLKLNEFTLNCLRLVVTSGLRWGSLLVKTYQRTNSLLGYNINWKWYMRLLGEIKPTNLQEVIRPINKKGELNWNELSFFYIFHRNYLRFLPYCSISPRLHIVLGIT